MLKNFFKITFRHLTRNSVYSFINIAGLSVGLACSLLILLWVVDELQFDRFVPNYRQLYQVRMNQTFADGIGTQLPLPYPLSEALPLASSQIKRTAITNWGEGNLLAAGEKSYNKFGLSATENFLSMFQFPLLHGNRSLALQDPRSIVLTESTARALFGKTEVLNQLVKIDNTHELKVSAVLKDLPDQSTFQFDYLLPFAFFEATNSWVGHVKGSWRNNSFQIYAELNPDATVDDVNRAIGPLVKNNNPEANTAEVFLHAMKDWRLRSNFENGKQAGGNIEYVQLFSAIAIFILVIACINFMNLATARSEGRAREVGIRKSVGSRRKELILQFLGESVLIALIGFALALALTEGLLPFYNQLVDKNLTIDYTNTTGWLLGLGIVLLTGLLAGSYPAFYLSAFKPVNVLKGKFIAGRHGTRPRQVLVTFQFAFSIFLIAGTVVVYQQIMHVKNREVGYNKDRLMLVWTSSDLEKNFDALRQELTSSGFVASVCKSNSPVTRIFSHTDLEWPGKDPGLKAGFVYIATEYDYTQTLGIAMLQGRDFSRDFKSDSAALVINEAAANLMGLEEPVGTRVKWNESDYTIIGVMQNVVMGDPYQPVGPMVMAFNPYYSSTITLRINSGTDLTDATATVERIFKKFNPAYPFEFRFADDEFNRKFSSLQLISQLAGWFSALAIVITCLGLFGLAAFTAEQRAKEVGIRKILGASVASVVMLISRDFSRLVIVALVLAFPLVWWASQQFLQNYAYRIESPWWVAPAVGLGTLLLALAVVSTQAWKAAVANPVDSLRSE